MHDIVTKYLWRFQAVRRLVLKNEDILSNLGTAIRHKYNGGELSDVVQSIGKGESQEVFRVGQVNLDGQVLFLALKLGEYPFTQDHFMLEEQIAGMSAAFIQQELVPYFTGMIKWRRRYFGVLTEDISEGGAYILDDFPPRVKYVARVKDGLREDVFVDPIVPGKRFLDPNEVMNEYLKSENLIVVPKKYLK